MAGSGTTAAAHWRMTAGRRRIAVGVDGSPNSLAALRCAIGEARHCHASLDVIYVVRGASDLSARRAGGAILDIALSEVAPCGLDVPSARIIAEGDPARVLVDYSEHCERLLIGGRVNSEQPNLLGGDVVPYCLSHAECPVEVCSDRRVGPRRAVATACADGHERSEEQA